MWDPASKSASFKMDKSKAGTCNNISVLAKGKLNFCLARKCPGFVSDNVRPPQHSLGDPLFL